MLLVRGRMIVRAQINNLFSCLKIISSGFGNTDVEMLVIAVRKNHSLLRLFCLFLVQSKTKQLFLLQENMFFFMDFATTVPLS
jgi:hypothetical protein